ncbi:MAG: dephospho-CoA kinase [Prevotella sp.]
MKRRIAITGGIGSGKSYVCRKLERQGIRIYDCDDAAKRLMRESPALRQSLIGLIGTDAYLPDGSLNKAAIASFLLASDDNARALNSIVHPAVAEDFMQSDKRWMECAILYESGFNRLVDTVVAVVAPDSLRVKRIMERDGIDAGKAQEWIAKQMPTSELIQRADFVIHNGEQDNLEEQLERLAMNMQLA